MRLWNVVGRIDPNMRKVRGLLVTQECKEDIWQPYDELLTTLEVREDPAGGAQGKTSEP